MERLIYILDTNAIADYINGLTETTQRINQAILNEHTLLLCQPVQYEVLRGLLKVNATRKRQIFEEQFAPHLVTVFLTDEDWIQAAQFWADTRKRGRQFSDVDLLIAAIAVRLDAVIVSSDGDFDALPVKRENWREPILG